MAEQSFVTIGTVDTGEGINALGSEEPSNNFPQNSDIQTGSAFWFALRNLTQFSDDIFEEEVGNIGLAPEEYFVLKAFSLSEYPNILKLQEETGLARSDLRRIILRLQMVNYIALSDRSEHGPARVFSLTENGSDILVVAENACSIAKKRIMIKLSGIDDSFVESLNIVERNLKFRQEDSRSNICKNDDGEREEADQGAQCLYDSEAQSKLQTAEPQIDTYSCNDSSSGADADIATESNSVLARPQFDDQDKSFDSDVSADDKAYQGAGASEQLTGGEDQPKNRRDQPSGYIDRPQQVEGFMNCRREQSGEKSTSVQREDAREFEVAKADRFDVRKLRIWTTIKLLEDSPVSLKEALETCFCVEINTIDKVQIQILAEKLNSLRIGISPDPRYALKGEEFSDLAILFRLPASSYSSNLEVSEPYRAASLMLHLGIFSAQADNRIADEEIKLLTEEIAGAPGQAEIDRVRLQADLKRLMWSKAPQEFMSGLLEGLSLERKEQLAQLAFRVISADKIIQAEEVILLKWLYEKLEFSQDNIEQKLDMLNHLPGHMLNFRHEPAPLDLIGKNDVPHEEIIASADELPGNSGTAREQIPDRRKLNLCEDSIASIRRSSDSAASLLKEIFVDSGSDQHVEDDEPDVGISKFSQDDISMVEQEDAISQQSSPFDGLDDQHQKLLVVLLKVMVINSTRFSEITRKFGLMPEGAIETLNEWAYQKYDEAVFEDDNPIQVSDDFAALLRKNVQGQTAVEPSIPAAATAATEPTVSTSETAATQTPYSLQDQKPVAVNLYAGLDQLHQKLLGALLNRSSLNSELSREDFVRCVRVYDLVPGNALKTLNDWSVKACGEPIIKVGLNVEINNRLVELMRSGS